MNSDNIIFFNKKRVEIYNMICYCLDNIPFYRNNSKYVKPKSIDVFDYKCFMECIPLLNKETLRNSTEQFISDKISVESLLYESTSGTEGKPLVCYKSQKVKLFYSKILWENRIEASPLVSPISKFVRFYSFRREGNNTITDPIFYKNNVLHLSLFNLSDDVLKRYWKEISLFKPKWILSVPSAVIKLSETILKYNLPMIPLEFIEVTGEYISEENLFQLKEVFGCPICNHYGAREFWNIAYSINDKVLKISDKSVYVESVFNPKINKNEIVVTSLKNNAWGLLRYRIGDVGDVVADGNSIEDFGFNLLLKEGRVTEYIFLDDNQIVNPIVFSFLVRKYNEIRGGKYIDSYQIVKQRSGLVLRLKCRDNTCFKEITEFFNKEIDVLFSSIQIKFEFVDSIDIDPLTGKQKIYIDVTEQRNINNVNL